MQMKRTLGMLLALCFLMSVTVAAVGAVGQPSTGNWGNYTPPAPNPAPAPHPHPAPAPIHINPAPHSVPVPAPHPHPAPAPVFKPEHSKGKWVPGHYEMKLVDKTVKIHGHWVVVKEWKHGHLVVVKILKNVWVPGQWVKVPGHR